MKRLVEQQVRNPIELDSVRQSQRCSEPATRAANVLVVDDEEPMCEILSLYLGFKGLSVKTTQTAGEVLDALSEMRFDLVILDWDLAGVESLDLLNYFKATRPEMAVIIFTGKEADESFLTKALQGRADAVLPKLGSLESLWQHLSQHLEKRISSSSSVTSLAPFRSRLRDI